MSLPATQEPIPLETDKDGAIRVAGTRVTLDTLVAAFNRGATSEEIAQDYPPLQLSDVYAVLTYYLRHRQEVESYLGQRREKASRVRQENERRFPSSGLRERLMARLPR
jgi:uncharacterized protein (DUF433 family)